MSEHDRFQTLRRRREPKDRRWVICHRGSYTDFLKRHRKQAQQAAHPGIHGIQGLAPHLFERTTDERTLMVAFAHLRERGGQAPGGDGLTFGDYPKKGLWGILRGIRDEIRSGKWERGLDRVIQIPKGNGRGDRTITIPDIDDRVVERAVVEIVQPLLDELFDDHSLGYRPGRGRLQALALAEQYLLQEQRTIWVTQDVRDAFDNVPLARALQIFRHYLPAEDLVRHVGDVLRNDKHRGLRQGGPLSPLMLNLYLHHILDYPWRRQPVRKPLIRVADDLLLPCKTVGEAAEAHSALKDALEPAGMPLKFAADEVIHDLDAGAAVDWLGYHLTVDAGTLEARISPGAWDRIEEKFIRSYDKKSSDENVLFAIVRGWISELGPCFPFEQPLAVHGRLKSMACEVGFRKFPKRRRFVAYWQRAYARWEKLRRLTANCFDEVRQGM